jgi:LmbE family N-acetylglucosaminyl deacetylase
VIRLDIPPKGAVPLTVLCLGAHSDDIEIGCGATLLYLKAKYTQINFQWIVFTAAGPRIEEAAKAADLFTAGCEKKVTLKDFEDRYLPYSGREVKKFFDDLRKQVEPDLIFTHWRGDAHQDHRLISELTSNTFRNHLILEYEIPKYDGDMGRPNVFVPLESSHYETKIDILLEAFETQRTKRWFERETFLSLMRLRGMECNSASGYAEAFHCHKMAL